MVEGKAMGQGGKSSSLQIGQRRVAPSFAEKTMPLSGKLVDS